MGWGEGAQGHSTSDTQAHVLSTTTGKEKWVGGLGRKEDWKILKDDKGQPAEERDTLVTNMAGEINMGKCRN